MASIETGPEENFSAARTGPHANHPEALSELSIIEFLIERFLHRAQQDQFQPSVGDFIRLIQLKRELSNEQPKEVTVQWVDPTEDTGSSAR